MSDDERPLFDDEIIETYRRASAILKDSANEFSTQINSASDLSNNQVLVLLSFLGDTTFRFLPSLYQSSVFNMALLNDLDRVINNLPEQFHQIKKQYRELVKLTKEQHDYVKWATKVQEDLAKDLEKPNGGKHE
jgi:tRNA(Glu) U13 pseudouridine synthase TruD